MLDFDKLFDTILPYDCEPASREQVKSVAYEVFKQCSTTPHPQIELVGQVKIMGGNTFTQYMDGFLLKGEGTYSVFCSKSGQIDATQLISDAEA